MLHNIGQGVEIFQNGKDVKKLVDLLLVSGAIDGGELDCL